MKIYRNWEYMNTIHETDFVVIALPQTMIKGFIILALIVLLDENNLPDNYKVNIQPQKLYSALCLRYW